MDTLKSCITNIHTLMSGPTDPIVVQVLRASTPSTEASSQDFSERLRNVNVLCAERKLADCDQIWTFRASSAPKQDLNDPGWEETYESVITPTLFLDSKQASPSEVDERISMLGHALSRAVQRDRPASEDIFPIDHLTWIIQQPRQSESLGRGGSNLIKTLSLEVTAAHSVVCLTTTRCTMLTTLTSFTRNHLGMDDRKGHVNVLVMPLKLRARLITIVDATDNLQLCSDAAQWFCNHFTFLRLRQSANLADETWLILEILQQCPDTGRSTPPRRGRRVLWPSSLCLASTLDGCCKSHAHLDSAMNYTDPIRMAEQWFQSSGLRDQQDTAAQSENGLPEYAQQIEDESLATTSPLYLRNEQGSVQGVYPTPPDGFVQNLNTSHPVLESEARAEDVTLDVGSLLSPTRESREDVAMADQDDDDNLFGDMDDEMLGNPEITDADFNFFNEESAPCQMTVDGSSPTGADLQVGSAPSPIAINPPEVNEASMIPSHDDAHDNMDILNMASSVSRRPRIISPRITGASVEIGTSLPPQSPPDTPPLSPVIVRSSIMNEAQENTATSAHDLSYAPVSFWPSAADSRSKYSRGGKFDARNSADDGTIHKSPPKRSISLHDYEHPVKKAALARGPSLSDRPQFSAVSTDSDESDTDSVEMRDLDDNRDETSVSAARDTQKLPRVFGAAFDMEGMLNATKDAARTIQEKHTLDDMALTKAADMTCLEARETGLWNIFDFDSKDLITIAQYLASQSAFPGHGTVPASTDLYDQIWCTMQQSANGLSRLVNSELLSLIGLAAIINSTVVTDSEEKPSMRLGMRRLMLPNAYHSLGQVLYFLGAPFARVRRAEATWDLLTSAIQFWDVLGLEALHPPKDIIADVIMVGNDDVRLRCTGFLNDLRYHYEATKLGAFALGCRVLVKTSDMAVKSPSENHSNTRTALLMLKKACSDLAHKLLQKSKKEGSPHHVVFIFSPFESAAMNKYICACFQTIVKELDKVSNKFTLRIIPFPWIAGLGAEFSQPDGRWASTQMALSLYDAVPSDEQPSKPSSWKGFAAKSLALVSQIPRKINFALSEQPPINLLTEAQILHVACAISADGKWLVIAWTDFTGSYQDNLSFSLHKTSIDTIMIAVKGYMSELMTAKTTWRVIVAFTSPTDTSFRAHWTGLASPFIAVTTVQVSLSPAVQIYSNPGIPEADLTAPTTPAIPQTSTLTPASTPQATGAPAISPETNQPPTPSSAAEQAQSATAAALEAGPTTDTDAHLIDTRDDSYGLILPFPATPRASGINRLLPRANPPLASGLLLKRSEARPGMPLPALGVDVLENVQPKIPPGRPSWIMPRAPEYVLREVLGWYRGLAVLGRLRGVRGCEVGEVPWHVGVAVAAARGLDGFFD